MTVDLLLFYVLIDLYKCYICSTMDDNKISQSLKQYYETYGYMQSVPYDKHFTM